MDWGTHKQWLAPEPGDHAITELSTEGVQLTPMAFIFYDTWQLFMARLMNQIHKSMMFNLSATCLLVYLE